MAGQGVKIPHHNAAAAFFEPRSTSESSATQNAANEQAGGLAAKRGFVEREITEENTGASALG